jgi:(S)-mandelate dehydrogenase
LLPAIKDYRELARQRLSRFAFDYLEGGAEDGRTLARNRAAYEKLLFSPRILKDVAQVDASVEVFGRRQSMPVLVGPTGLNGLYWPRAEEALARAAHEAGVPFVMSTASTSLIEDVRAASSGELWLQLYVQRDRRIAQDMMRRARAAGFSTVMLTVDTTVHGKRDHDLRNGFRMPVRLTARLLADLAMHPRWCARMLRQGGSPQLVNLASSAGLPNGLEAQAAAMSRDMDMSLCWADIAWLRDHWPGRVVVKGLLCAEDACAAREHGVDGIVVSNHGGRQLESAPSPLEVCRRWWPRPDPAWRCSWTAACGAAATSQRRLPWAPGRCCLVARRSMAWPRADGKACPRCWRSCETNSRSRCACWDSPRRSAWTPRRCRRISWCGCKACDGATMDNRAVKLNQYEGIQCPSSRSRN